MAPDDLLFQEVCRLFTPALIEAGYPPATDGDAKLVTSLRFWQEEPETRFFIRHESRYRPITRRGKTEYVLMEEPVLQSSTTYAAGILLECRARTSPKDTSGKRKKAANGAEGEQLWRTQVRIIGPRDDMRDLLQSAVVALRGGVLASQGHGLRSFEVYINDKGEREVTEQ